MNEIAINQSSDRRFSNKNAIPRRLSGASFPPAADKRDFRRSTSFPITGAQHFSLCH
jgi:hypothetical protein